MSAAVMERKPSAKINTTKVTITPMKNDDEVVRAYQEHVMNKSQAHTKVP